MQSWIILAELVGLASEILCVRIASVYRLKKPAFIGLKCFSCQTEVKQKRRERLEIQISWNRKFFSQSFGSCLKISRRNEYIYSFLRVIQQHNLWLSTRINFCNRFYCEEANASSFQITQRKSVFFSCLQARTSTASGKLIEPMNFQLFSLRKNVCSLAFSPSRDTTNKNFLICLTK